MKKSQANFVLLTVLILLPIIFFGQTRVLQTPEKYLMPTENVVHPKPDDVLSSRPWFVFSDRSDNPVYATSESIATNSVLDFGEACVALEVKNNRLLLAKPEDISQGRLLPDKTPIGWVDFDNLLLWDNCLKTETCKLDKKAMVLNVSDLDNSKVPEQNPTFYHDAGIEFDPVGEAGTRIAQLYFVYKETADFLLLGESSSFEESAFNDVVVGWIPKIQCLIWNSNLAIEINWDQLAVAERERMKNQVIIWENETDAAAFNKNSKHLFVEPPFYRERSNGFHNRFFILEQQDHQVDTDNNRPLKVGFFINDTLSDQENIERESILKNLGLTDDEIETILRGGLKQTYHEGYTFLQTENAEYQWFKYVLLIERREMEQLISAIRDLVASKDYTINEQRVRLIKATEYMFYVFYGNLSRNSMHKIKFGDLFFCVTGQPWKGKFSNLKISDLANERVISTADIREFVQKLQETLKALEEIYYLRRSYPRLLNPGGSNEIYYWVPVETFPHN